MQFSEIINSSQAALRRNRMRTALTMLGIVIGISSVILISSIGAGAVAFITEELSSFGTNYFQITSGQGFIGSFAGTSNPLTKKDADAILNESGITNIDYVAAFTMSTRKITANDQEDHVLVYGINSASQYILQPDIIFGEFFTEEHDQGIIKEVVIGVDVAEDFFGPETNPVGETLRIDDSRYKIIGVTQSSGGFAGSFLNNAINVPLDTMTSQITGDDSLQEMDISVIDENQLNQTADDVENFLRERRDLDEEEESDFTIMTFKESLEIVQTVTSLLTAMIAAISGISLIVGGVGVMNIMLVTVTERTKQIGLLKAIGAKQKDILIQFLVEAVGLSLMGGIIGIIIGISGAFVVSQVANIPFIVNPMSVILAVGVSSLVGIIFGLYPARRAARLNPIEALRHE